MSGVESINQRETDRWCRRWQVSSPSDFLSFCDLWQVLIVVIMVQGFVWRWEREQKVY